jgi:Cu(I)/Ag(I) efflux system membrane fusion protein
VIKAFLKKIEKPRCRVVLIVVLVAAAFVVGYVLRGRTEQARGPGTAERPASEQAKVEVWTCAMHPQIRQPKPGRCPICGMDLIPATSGEVSGAAVGPPELRLSPEAIALANIEVAPVERKVVAAEIKMVGKIEYDETRLAYITAWFPGRLDRLYVDYTGIAVRKGDHMVLIYSPELLTAQEELLQALRTVEELAGSDLTTVRRTARQTVEAAREKLRLWGLTKDQIEQIEKSGVPREHMTVYAPIGGIVIQKHVAEGAYVDTGTRIYTIADLAHVWARLDAYESDIEWLKYGQQAEFETESYPGEVFTGKIAFIDPVLDAKTRTVKVRVNVLNPDGKLKPEMFVRATVRSRVAAGGKVVEPDLMGKWMCPMHPEIVKDGPGACDICGMPLATTESLGYVSADEVGGDQAPLVIPASAPLITGERAVVYVQVPEKAGAFEGREIVLGPRAGDYYLVEKGLHEGELVVVNGNFKIDSALQIIAKPSMMSPEGGAPPPGHQHGDLSVAPGAEREAQAGAPRSEVPDAFKTQLDSVFTAYFDVQQSLSRDDLDAAQTAAKKALNKLDAVDMTLLEGPLHMAWMKEHGNIETIAKKLSGEQDIEKARQAFAQLSESLAVVAKKFGTSGAQPILRFHCPMAFDGRGADWLQNRPGTENPYFGATMFTCGKQTEVIVEGGAT